MITQVIKSREDIFGEQTIHQNIKIVGAHGDGITSIELIEENEAFITASFDCCCHIWNINNGEKVGSLLLGGDLNWKLVFNMQQRKVQAWREAEQLLQRIGKKKMSFYLQGATEQEQKEMQVKKQGVLKGALELLQNQKKATEKNDNIVNIVGVTKKLQNSFFEEQEDSSFNLLAELTTMRNNILTTTKRRK